MNITKYGIYAGLFMAGIMSLMSVTGNYSIGIIKYLKYIVLLIFLWRSASEIKSYAEDKRFFGKTSISGIKISAIAGVILLVSCLVLFAIEPSYAPMKFNLLPETWGEVGTIGIMLLIETIVIGFILNFIIVQGLKPGVEASTE